MPTAKLTKAMLAKLSAPHPSGKQMLVWDTELKGFGVLLSGKTRSRSYVVQHTLADGKTRRMTIGPVNTLDLDGPDGARSRAKALIAQFYAGIDPKAEQRKARAEAARQATSTLRAVLDNYLIANRKLSAESKVQYRRMIEHHLSGWLDLPLREISPQMVQERHAAIAAEIAARNAGSRRGGGEATGAGSANLTMSILGILWTFAAEPNRTPDLGPSPTRTLRRSWFELSRRERLVKADDLPTFYRAVDALPNRTAGDYIKLMLFTGLRRREAASLKWADIDFTARLIRLPAARTKAGRALDLPMSGFVLDLLRSRRTSGEGVFVFPTRSKSGFIQDASFALQLVANETGIEICAHDLRRTFITIAEAADISPLALRALVNHTVGGKSDVTAGYVQMTMERLREPVERVCHHLLELCQIEIARPRT